MVTRPQFSFASVEAALVASYRVPQADQARFRARVTHAQKAGLFGVRPGKGTRLTYGPDELHKLILVCEMSELGIAPAVQLELIDTLWDQRLREIFKRAEAAAMHPPGGEDIVVILTGASLMIQAWAGAVPNVNHCRLDQLCNRLELAMRGDPHALPPRALMANLSARLRVLHNALADAHFEFEQPQVETDKVRSQHRAPNRARDPQRAGRRTTEKQ